MPQPNDTTNQIANNLNRLSSDDFEKVKNIQPEGKKNTIKIGKNILDLISKFDIGQSIVARKNHILGVEGIEGTINFVKTEKVPPHPPA